MIPNRPESIRKLVGKLGASRSLRVCYEAGPCGAVSVRANAEMEKFHRARAELKLALPYTGGSPRLGVPLVPVVAGWNCDALSDDLY